MFENTFLDSLAFLIYQQRGHLCLMVRSNIFSEAFPESLEPTNPETAPPTTPPTTAPSTGIGIAACKIQDFTVKLVNIRTSLTKIICSHNNKFTCY